MLFGFASTILSRSKQDATKKSSVVIRHSRESKLEPRVNKLYQSPLRISQAKSNWSRDTSHFRVQADVDLASSLKSFSGPSLGLGAADTYGLGRYNL